MVYIIFVVCQIYYIYEVVRKAPLNPGLPIGEAYSEVPRLYTFSIPASQLNSLPTL